MGPQTLEQEPQTYLPFRTLRVVDVRHGIAPRTWFTSVDLKYVYFHISIACNTEDSSRQYTSVPSPTLRSLSFSLRLHTVGSGGTGTSSVGGHADSPVFGRSADMIGLGLFFSCKTGYS